MKLKSYLVLEEFVFQRLFSGVCASSFEALLVVLQIKIKIQRNMR